MHHSIRFTICALAALGAGCVASGNGRTFVFDLAGSSPPADASMMSPGPDLATASPDLATNSPDLSINSPDLAIPPDLGTSPDVATPPDLANRPDLAMPDLRVAGCRVNGDCMNGGLCCAGTCVDGQNDPTNCGACGLNCGAPNATTTCRAGACALSGCSPGFKDCDGKYGNGCEADSMSDPNNCGGCGNICGNGRCTTKLLADMTSKPAGWNWNGSAAYDANAKTTVLTPFVTKNQAGTLLYSLPALVDEMQVEFDFKLDASQGRADGIGFMIQSNGPLALGRSGGAFAMGGLDGWGVEIDLYNNGNCSDTGGNGNHAGVDTLKICDMVDGSPTSVVESADLFAAVGDIGDAKWRHATITLSAGKITLVIDTKTILSGIALPGFNPQTPYYFGFGGGTGILVARQEIRNVAIAFPTGRCL